MSGLSVVPLEGIPEIEHGDDLAALVVAGAAHFGGLHDGDVVVVAQKAVSKAEGRVIDLSAVEPSPLAVALAGDHDARYVEAVLAETERVVRARAGFVIGETRHGFVCGSAGVDASNAPARGHVVLLPQDPDDSAARLRRGLVERTGRTVAVVVSDSFGRAWRQGTTDVAIGAAGLSVLLDLKGQHDPVGYELKGTTIAVADEIAGAAELVMGKLARVPAAVVRGLAHLAGEGRARDLAMPRERDLFR